MTLDAFARDLGDLSPTDQSQFAATVEALLTQGFLMRDEEIDRSHYGFWLRWPELVRQWLAVAGWQVNHDDRLGIVHVRHRSGAHRQRFGRETTIWLLVIRLVYAEEVESLRLSLTRHPVVPLSAISERYQGFFSGKPVRRKTAMADALRVLQAARLVRPAEASFNRSLDPESLWELLPSLEIVVPAQDVAGLLSRLQEYRQAPDGDEPGVAP